MVIHDIDCSNCGFIKDALCDSRTLNVRKNSVSCPECGSVAAIVYGSQTTKNPPKAYYVPSVDMSFTSASAMEKFANENGYKIPTTCEWGAFTARARERADSASKAQGFNDLVDKRRRTGKGDQRI